MSEPVIEFAESLPVSAMRGDSMDAMARNQVIIVCGETGSGSGKSYSRQPPKEASDMNVKELFKLDGRVALVTCGSRGDVGVTTV